MKNVLRFGVLTAFLCCPFAAHPATVQQQWAVRFNADLAVTPKKVVVDSDGNAIIAGDSFGFDGTDYIIVKYNPNGNELWNRRFNGPNSGGFTSDDIVADLAVDTAGNVYVTGTSYGTIQSRNDIVTLKYSAAGSLTWSNRYNVGTANETATGVALDTSGNVFISGYGLVVTGQGSDFAVIKYNANGTFQWARTFNGPANITDNTTDIIADNNGNCYVTGIAQYGGTEGGDITTIKYDPNGTTNWTQRFSTTSSGNFETAISVRVDSQTNVYVGGQVYTSASTAHNFAVIKYNSGGVQQWSNYFSSAGGFTDNPKAMELDSLGNIYIAGYESTNSGSQYLITLVKYNPSGAQQWASRYYSAASPNNPVALALDSAGNSYLCSSVPGVDFVTSKINSNGVRQWAAIYNSTNYDDISHSIAVDSAGNAFVLGVSNYDAPPGGDFVSVKYINPTPRLTSPSVLANRNFQFKVEGGESNAIYQLQYSTNLNNSTNWLLLTTITNLTGTNLVTDTSASNSARRFYRARQAP